MKQLPNIVEGGYRKKKGIRWMFYLAGLACLFMVSGCAMDQARKKEQADAHIKIGTAYIEAGDNNGALKELLQAERYAPRDPRVHYFLAVAYQGRGYQEKALDECKTAIALKEDYSDAHNLLGTLYMARGDNELAVNAFKMALQNMLYETPAVALYNLARTYHRIGQFNEAMARYQEAATKDGRGDLLPLIEHGMGKAAFDQGDTARAVRHLKRSTEMAPMLADSYYWLGECYVKQGKKREAKAVWETLILLSPDSELGRSAKEKIRAIKI